MKGRAGCHLHNNDVLFHIFEEMKQEKVEDEREGTESCGTPLFPEAGV